jgi:hypothetical protein
MIFILICTIYIRINQYLFSLCLLFLDLEVEVILFKLFLQSQVQLRTQNTKRVDFKRVLNTGQVPFFKRVNLGLDEVVLDGNTRQRFKKVHPLGNMWNRHC